MKYILVASFLFTLPAFGQSAGAGATSSGSSNTSSKASATTSGASGSGMSSGEATNSRNVRQGNSNLPTSTSGSSVVNPNAVEIPSSANAPTNGAIVRPNPMPSAAPSSTPAYPRATPVR